MRFAVIRGCRWIDTALQNHRLLGTQSQINRTLCNKYTSVAQSRGSSPCSLVQRLPGTLHIMTRSSHNESPGRGGLLRFENITKSEEDDRLYRGLELENGMRVLLVSDPETERSAASMSVGVGHMSDPDNIPGLAHFLEHMLFLGTEKYPDAGEYLNYLSRHGGSANAGTYADSTKYYFDITPAKFSNALDRFAQFFIAPLYTEELTEKEINAIESEHQKNLQIDAWRIRMVGKSMIDKAHPYSKFGTGNKWTLWENTKENDIKIREELINFQNRWYSANIMGLAVSGRETLDELEEMVIAKFAAVKSKGIEAPHWQPLVYEEGDQKGMQLNVVPVKDSRSLCISFPCPDFDTTYYRSSPDRYCAHLLGYEGEGSLLSELKKKGFCNNLMAGYSTTARGFGFFDVIMELTETGFEEVNEIITMLFQFIRLMREEGPQKRIFDEYAQLTQSMFRFREKESPMSMVTNVSPSLHLVPMEDMLTAGLLVQEWRPEHIEYIFSFLEPAKMRVVLVGKKLEEICDQTEKWYGTKYNMHRITDEWMERWTNVELNASFYLPKPNPFVATDFSLVERTPQDVTEHPVVIYDTEYIRVWHKLDDEFKKPKSVLYFNLSSPIVYSDPQNCNLTNLFVQLFLESINEDLYNADIAGLKVSLKNTTYGIGLTMSGFSDKQPMFLDWILRELFNYTVDEKTFELFKERYIRSLRNAEAEQPYQLAIYYLSVILSENAWTKQELLESAKVITPEMLQRFVKQFLSKIHVECFLYGNVDRAGAMSLVGLLEEKLKKTYSVALPLLARQLFPKREYKLENSCNYLYEKENAIHSSSCILAYLQFGEQSDRNNIYTDLLVQIMSEPFSNELRTKEQLGYITFCSTRKINGSQGVRGIVQSSYPPDYVNERIEVFFANMEKEIDELSEKKFNSYKDSLTANKIEKPKKMVSWFNKYWAEIASQEYHFNRSASEVEILKGITKEDMLAYYREHVLRTAEKRRKLSVHIVSQVKSANSDKTSEEERRGVMITDLSAFKSSKELYPIVQPYMPIRRKGGRCKL